MNAMPYCYWKGQICSGLLSLIFPIGEIDVCAMCILLKIMEPNAIALICLHMFHSICTFLYSTWTSLILHPMSRLPWSAWFQSRFSGICCILLTVLQQKYTKGYVAVVATLFPCIPIEVRNRLYCSSCSSKRLCQGTTTTWNCSWDGPCLLVPTG
jgi:hypothetical protein